MDRIERAAPPAWLMRLAGSLLIVMGAVILVYPQGWVLNPQELADDPHRLSWLWYSIPIALVIGLPPVLVGIGVLLRSAGARLVGIVMALGGTLACGAILAANVSGGFTALWAVVLVISTIVLGMLLAATYMVRGRIAS